MKAGRAWQVRLALGAILALAAALRFYGLAWGAPYAHFHTDEHLVFVGAYDLRHSMRQAASASKFFTYGTLPMHMLNAIVWVYEHLRHRLDLTTFSDQVTYMVMGRAISAAMGTATVAVVYVIAKRIGGRLAGLLAAFLLATAVIHIAESHSFRVDLTMVFFLSLTWLWSFQVAMRGWWRDYLLAGLFAGCAIACKLQAPFILGVVAIAHLLTTNRPNQLREWSGWARWTARGLLVLVVAFAVFAVTNPMAFIYSGRFREDVQAMIIDPVIAGSVQPIWMAQFKDIQPQLYWITTTLPWSFGPALEIWGLIGILWLLWQRSRPALVAAAFPIVYLLGAGSVATPYARYTLPLAPALAVTAACLSTSLLKRPRWRIAALAITAILVTTTGAYALAYMNVYHAPDARLAASKYLSRTVPRGAAILVEPAHSIPPTGTYLQNPQFLENYVLWDADGPGGERHDYYSLYSLDMYRRLYRGGLTDDQKREYIASRLALVDYILMDDFYLQLYSHLPASQHGVVQQYYRDLFGGRLGFALDRTFKVYPKIFGVEINDDAAELSSRMNDHPRIYLFRRTKSR